MADLAGIRIRAAIHGVFRNQAAADAGGKRQIKQRPAAAPSSIQGFAQRARVGIVIHDWNKTEQICQVTRQVEIRPSGSVGGQDYALLLEIHRAAKANAATIEAMAGGQSFDNGLDLR